MSFIVTSNPTFEAPVVANIPDNGGRTKRIKFSVVFKALSKPEVDDLLQRIREHAGDARKDSATPLNDRGVIDEVLVGFGPDLLEEDRTPMVFNEANVDRLCKIWPLEAAIVRSFFDNYIQAPTKN